MTEYDGDEEGDCEPGGEEGNHAVTLSPISVSSVSAGGSMRFRRLKAIVAKPVWLVFDVILAPVMEVRVWQQGHVAPVVHTLRILNILPTDRGFPQHTVGLTIITRSPT